MSATPIGSPMLKARIPLLLDLPEQAWFDVAMMQKTSASPSKPLRRSTCRCHPPLRRTRCCTGPG